MHKFRNLVIAASLPLILVLAVAIPVLAEESSTDNTTANSETKKQSIEKAKAEARQAEAKAKAEAAKAKTEEAKQKAEAQKAKVAEKKEKLKEDKLKICQARENRINQTMDKIASAGQKRLDLISQTAEKTMSFYEAKGKNLSNYAELVSALSSKKVAAQAAVDDVKSTSVTFNCGGDDPKGTGSNFKAKVNAMNTALKEYRTAVKNLIVAVKSVQAKAAEQGGSQ